jgi:putative endonuclease
VSAVGREGRGQWFCYVLECADGTLYTGITRSLDRRLSTHNRGRASRYTRGRRPVRLVYAEPHPDRSSASRREIDVKKMSRTKKRALLVGSCRRSGRRRGAEHAPGQRAGGLPVP